MYQYDLDRRRSGLRLDAQKRRKRNNNKRIIAISISAAVLLAVFALLCAFGAINVRRLFGKPGGSDTPVVWSSSDADSPIIPNVTDDETEAPSLTESDSAEADSTEDSVIPNDTTAVMPSTDTSSVGGESTGESTVGTSDISVSSDTADTSDTSSIPDTSDTSNITDSSSVPDTSDAPITSNTPNTSFIPDTSNAPSSSDMPVSSDITSAPDTSDTTFEVTDTTASTGVDIETEGPVLKPSENRFEWPCVLKESEAAGDDYFEDCLFIGDSRMQGLEIACRDSKATFFTAVSVTSRQIDTREGVRVIVDGEVKQVTIIDAIKLSGRQFKRIYMMFGINELGSNGGTEAIIRDYIEAIGKVKAIQPDAKICVMGVMPVFNSCKYVAGYKGYEANPRILELNIAMIEMADRMKLYYLDSYHLFATEDGQLMPEVSRPDEGIHLYGSASRELMEYIKNHAIRDKRRGA